MTFILGIFIIFLNYNFLNYTMEGDLSESILLGSMILFCFFLRIISKVFLSYKGILNEHKFIVSMKVMIKSLIDSIVIFILALICEVVTFNYMLNTLELVDPRTNPLLGIVSSLLNLVLIALIILAVPFILVSLVSNRVCRHFEKENKKVINRNNKIAAKQKEQQMRIQQARNHTLNKLHRETKKNICHIINQLDTTESIMPFSYENNISYTYDKSLNLQSIKPREKWLDNDEKLNYYKKLFDNLNLKFYGNYDEYLMHLREKERYLSKKLISYSKEFNCLSTLIDSTESKINSFDKYIKTRQSYINLDYKSCKAGIEGENRVNEELSLYNNIINLSNIRLEVADNNNTLQSIENDNILLTKNGIFVLEVKNFGEIGNYDIIIEKDGRWLRKNRYNEEVSVFKNVTKQNNRHLAFLNKFINDNTNRSFDDYIEAEGIVVIANEKVTIENYNTNQNIFRDSELYSYITSQKPKFKEEELKQIRDLILSNNLTPKKYPIFDYSSEIVENIKNLERYLNDYENVVRKIEVEYDNYSSKKSII